ncbi:Alpha/Beta hydrolase protein [Gorgonomyces haynaldii]|nr:Alpha/Beta hydrolase protein [Gorgonomyces haynaldii]
MIGFGSSSDVIPSTTEALKFQKAKDFLHRPRSSLLLKLRSGEQLSYCECGPATGIPVVWFQGPTHNRFVIGLYEEMANELGLRLICFDRPGRGASTPPRYPKEWGFDSWAAYVDEATDLLKIEKFHIIAHSFGTSYLLASYERLQKKIIGSLRFLSVWAPTNLPCMPTTYAIQRSMPTGMIRRMMALSSSASQMVKSMPTIMGTIGFRERECANELHAKEILECMHEEVYGDDYNAYELDWLLALEIRKQFPYNHRTVKAPVKCWHGMDDDVAPLGAAMWLQREMNQFLLYAVEGATHNILLDFAIVRAVLADVSAEHMVLFKPEEKPQEADAQEKVEKKDDTLVPQAQGSAVEKPLNVPDVAGVWA